MTSKVARSPLVDQIRSVGERCGSLGVAFAMACFLAGFPLAYALRKVWHVPKEVVPWIASGVVTFFVFGIGGLVVAAYRQIQSRQLRRELGRLAPEERADILLPLQDETSPEIRKIVQPLIRHFGLQASTVTPSPAPAGGGNEMSAGE